MTPSRRPSAPCGMSFALSPNRRAPRLAALMSGAYKPAAGERVATLICGANTEPGSVA